VFLRDFPFLEKCRLIVSAAESIMLCGGAQLAYDAPHGINGRTDQKGFPRVVKHQCEASCGNTAAACQTGIDAADDDLWGFGT